MPPAGWRPLPRRLVNCSFLRLFSHGILPMSVIVGSHDKRETRHNVPGVKNYCRAKNYCIATQCPAAARSLFWRDRCCIRLGIGVQVRQIEVPTVFQDFDDLLEAISRGPAPAPGYCISLSEDGHTHCASASVKLFREGTMRRSI